METTKRVLRSHKPHKTVQNLHKNPMDFNTVMVGKGDIIKSVISYDRGHFKKCC